MDSGDEEYYYYSDEDEYSMGARSDGEDNASNKNKNQADGLGPTPAVSERASEGESAAPRETTESKVKAFQPRTSGAHSNKLEYTVLTPEMLEEEQDILVRNVSEVLDIDFDTSNVLLLHYYWNKEKLFDAYYADPEGTCSAAGALGPSKDHRMADVMEADAAAGGLFLCQILFIEVPYKFTYAMACGHRFSIDAWQNYLRGKVEDGKNCVFAMCPSDECKIVVSPKTWGKVLQHPVEDPEPDILAGNADALARYKRFLASSFVEINRTMRYCPGRNCKVAIKSTGAVASVKCTECGSLFCFKCGQEGHAPTSCPWLAQWQEKCSNESETANWILAHTKKCPKCQTRIEKNQGCNHMQCKVCKFDFCWVCMSSWADHGASTGGFYQCNRWKGGDESAAAESGADKDTNRAKQELDRYLHHYQRFAAHESAGKFAREQRERAERRMVEMQTASSLGWVDVQFLNQAVEQLIDCRRVLKNTYIHAYYLPPGPKKDLFMYLQSILESHTEKLSELSEKSLDDMDRAEVINFTRVTGKFLQSLLEQVDSEGIGVEDDHAVAAAGAAAPALPVQSDHSAKKPKVQEKRQMLGSSNVSSQRKARK